MLKNITDPEAGKLVANGFATIEQTGAFLAVSRSTVYLLLEAGQLPSRKIRRSRRIPWNSIHEFAAKDLA